MYFSMHAQPSNENVRGNPYGAGGYNSRVHQSVAVSSSSLPPKSQHLRHNSSSHGASRRNSNNLSRQFRSLATTDAANESSMLSPSQVPHHDDH